MKPTLSCRTLCSIMCSQLLLPGPQKAPAQPSSENSQPERRRRKTRGGSRGKSPLCGVMTARALPGRIHRPNGRSFRPRLSRITTGALCPSCRPATRAGLRRFRSAAPSHRGKDAVLALLTSLLVVPFTVGSGRPPRSACKARSIPTLGLGSFSRSSTNSVALRASESYSLSGCLPLDIASEDCSHGERKVSPGCSLVTPSLLD